MSNEPLFRDVRAKPKARWNSDIIKACSVPKLAHSRPVAQGIGLYTHVAGPRTAKLNSHFEYIDNTDREVALLPLGGPRRLQPSTIREPPTKELAVLYKELEAAVKAEEQTWSDQRAAASEKGATPKDAYKVSLAALEKKYGHSLVSAPSQEPTVLQHYDKDRDLRRRSKVVGAADSEAPKKRKVSFAPEPEPRRKSTGNIFIPNRRPDSERRASGSGNVYSRR